MQKSKKAAIWSRMPILVIALAAIFGAIYLRDFASLDSLGLYHAQLSDLVALHPVMAAAGFVVVYFCVVAFSLPGATVATLTGGFLFGLFPGVVYNVMGASLGAIAIFVAARAGFGADMAKRLSTSGGPVKSLIDALHGNQWSALLTMRLVPAIPFFLANLIPAFVGVGLVPFAVTTVAGIIPAAIIFTAAGAGIDQILAEGGALTLDRIASPDLVWPLFGLGALSALPMVIKGLKRK